MPYPRENGITDIERSLIPPDSFSDIVTGQPVSFLAVVADVIKDKRIVPFGEVKNAS